MRTAQRVALAIATIVDLAALVTGVVVQASSNDIGKNVAGLWLVIVAVVLLMALLHLWIDPR